MYKFILLCATVVQTLSFTPIIMQLNRREAIGASIAYAATSFINDDKSKICVIGSSSSTGRECVKILASQNQHVLAISRSLLDLNGLELTKEQQSFVDRRSIDIKDKNALTNDVFKDVSACIFVANAKKAAYNKYIKTDAEEFQNYEDIDVYALKNIIEKCKKNNVQKIVYVSASCRSCTDDPSSQYDKLCGISCENCQTKRIGETILQRSGIDYTIVRTGFLMQGPSRNISDIELTQDYSKSGIFYYSDLSKICINALKYRDTSRTTFEAYYRDTTQPYDIKESLNKCIVLGHTAPECFFGEEFKDKPPKTLEEARKTPIKGSLFTTGYEFSGNTWKELFTGLEKDK